MSKTTTKNKVLSLFVTLLIALGLTFGLVCAAINSPFRLVNQAEAEENVVNIVYKSGTLNGNNDSLNIENIDGVDYYAIATELDFNNLMTRYLISTTNNTMNIILKSSFQISFGDQTHNSAFPYQTNKPQLNNITVEGNGHRITFDGSVVFTNSGFFSKVDNCTIKNLTYHFNGSIEKANNAVTFGSFSDSVNGTKFTNTNMYNNGKVAFTDNNIADFPTSPTIGGLFGSFNGSTVENSHFESSSLSSITLASQKESEATSVRKIGGIFGSLSETTFTKSTITSSATLINTVPIKKYAKDLIAAGIAATASGAVSFNNCNVSVYGQIECATSLSVGTEDSEYGIVTGKVMSAAVIADASEASLSFTNNKIDIFSPEVSASAWVDGYTAGVTEAFAGGIAASVKEIPVFTNNIFDASPSEPNALIYDISGAIHQGTVGSFFGAGNVSIGENNWIITSERFENDADYWNDTVNGYWNDDHTQFIPVPRRFSGNETQNIDMKKKLNRVITYGNSHVDTFIRGSNLYFAPQNYTYINGGATPFYHWLDGNPSRTNINNSPGKILDYGNSSDIIFKADDILDQDNVKFLDHHYENMPVFSPNSAWIATGDGHGNTRKSITALHMFTEINAAYELTQLSKDTNGGMNYPWANITVGNKGVTDGITFKEGIDPIGSMAYPFLGTFNGNGATITFAGGTNIHANENVGFFGVNRGTITNFKLIFNGNLTLLSTDGAKDNANRNNVGVLVGHNMGKISNIDITIASGSTFKTANIGVSDDMTSTNTVFNMGGAIGKQSYYIKNGSKELSSVDNVNVINNAKMIIATDKPANLNPNVGNLNEPGTIAGNFGGAFGLIEGGVITHVTAEFQGSMQTTFRNCFYKMGGFAGKIDATNDVSLYAIGISIGAASVMDQNLTIFNPMSDTRAITMNFDWIGNFVGQIVNVIGVNGQGGSRDQFYVWISKGKDSSDAYALGDFSDATRKVDEVFTAYVYAHNDISSYYSSFTYIKNIGTKDNENASTIAGKGKIQEILVSAPINSKQTIKFSEGQKELIIRGLAVLSLRIDGGQLLFSSPSLKDTYIFTGWFDSASMTTPVSESVAIVSGNSIKPLSTSSGNKVYTRIISNAIYSVEDLNSIAFLVNGTSNMTFAGLELVLMENIIITKDYVPIGDSGSFKGILNGNGYKIFFDGKGSEATSKTLFKNTSSSLSLFGTLGEGAKVYNFTIEYKDIIGNFQLPFAGIAYRNYGQIGNERTTNPTKVIFNKCALGSLSIFGGVTVYNGGTDLVSSIYDAGNITGVEVEYINSSIKVRLDDSTQNVYLGGAVAYNEGFIMGILVNSENSTFSATGRRKINVGGVIGCQVAREEIIVTNIASNFAAVSGSKVFTLSNITETDSNYVEFLGANIGGLDNSSNKYIRNSYMLDNGLTYDSKIYVAAERKIISNGEKPVRPDGIADKLYAVSNKIGIYVGDDPKSPNVFGTLTVHLSGSAIEFTATADSSLRPFNVWRRTNYNGDVFDLTPTNGANNTTFRPVVGEDKLDLQFTNSTILVYFIKTKISTLADLNQVATDVSLGYNPVINYSLGNDIAIKGNYPQVIGTEKYPFAGTLAGGSKTLTIDGVNMESIIVGGQSKSYSNFNGLFGYLGVKANVSNIKIRVVGTPIKGQSENGFGLLAYSNLGLIEQIEVTIMTDITVKNYFGGLVAINDKTTVNNKPHYGKITDTTINHRGGNIDITSTSSINNTRFGYVAAINNGIIGLSGSSSNYQNILVTVQESHLGDNEHLIPTVIISNGVNTAIQTLILGGIAGVNTGEINSVKFEMDKGTVLVSYETKKPTEIGGIAGQNYGTIANVEVILRENTTLFAPYVQSGDSIVGGIVGKAFNNSVIRDYKVTASGNLGAKADGSAAGIAAGVVGKTVDNVTINNGVVEINGKIKAEVSAAGLIGVAGRPKDVATTDGKIIYYINNVVININARIEAEFYAAGLIAVNASNISLATVTINNVIEAKTNGSVAGGLIGDNEYFEGSSVFGYVKDVLVNLNAKVIASKSGMMAGKSNNGIAINSWVLTLNNTKQKVANASSSSTSESGFNSMKIVADANNIEGTIGVGTIKFTVPTNIRANVSMYGWYSNIANGVGINADDGTLSEPFGLAPVKYYTFEPKSVISNKEFHVSFVKLSISTQEELDTITKTINASDVFYGVRLQLVNDITIAQSSILTPIGTKEVPFSGVFDGMSKTITFETGSSIANDNSKGLFGYIGRDGIVKELKIYVEEGVFIQAVSAEYYYGILAGECDGKLSNILINAHSVPKGEGKIGAAVGRMGEKLADNVWVITYNSSLNTTANGDYTEENGAAQWSGAAGINKLSVIGAGKVATTFGNGAIFFDASGDNLQRQRFYKWMSNGKTNKALDTNLGYGEVFSNLNDKITYLPKNTVKSMMFTLSFIKLEIATAKEYVDFVSNANTYSGLKNTTVRVVNDIEIDGSKLSTKYIDPIGTAQLPFDGIFDGTCINPACPTCNGAVGNFHKITFKNVVFNGDFSAMFGRVAKEGKIINLTIETFDNTYGYLAEKEKATYGAGLAAYFDGYTKNVVVLFGKQTGFNSQFKNSFVGSFGPNAITENTWVVVDQFLNIATANNDTNGNNSVNSLTYAGVGTVGVTNNNSGITFLFKKLTGDNSIGSYLSKNDAEFSKDSLDRYIVQLGKKGEVGNDNYNTNSDGIRVNNDGNAIYNNLVVIYAKLEMKTADDLDGLATQINKGINYKNITYTLANDIIISKKLGELTNRLFTPIGGVVQTRYDGQMSFFSGIFNGNNHTITFSDSMYIDNGNSALFGRLDADARIKNLSVINNATIGGDNTRYAAILIAESTIASTLNGEAQVNNVVIYSNQSSIIKSNTMSSYFAANYNGTTKDVWVVATNNKFNEDILVDLSNNDKAREIDGINVLTVLGGGKVVITSKVDAITGVRAFSFNTTDDNGVAIGAKNWYRDFAYQSDHTILADDTNKITGDMSFDNIDGKRGNLKLVIESGTNRKLIDVTGGENLNLAVDFMTRNLTTEEDVVSLGEQVNKGYSFYGVEINLSNDIIINGSVKDVDGKSLIKPIGTKKTPFTAIFNGNNYAIELTGGISLANYEYSGFFGYVGEDAVIKNLIIRADDVTIGGEYVISGVKSKQVSAYAGLIAFNEGRLQNVIFETYGVKFGVAEELFGNMIYGLAIAESLSLNIENCWSIVKTSNNYQSVFKAKDIRLNEMTVVGRGDIKCSFENILNEKNEVIGTQIIFKEIEIKNRRVVKNASGNIISNDKEVGWYQNYQQGAAISSGGDGIVTSDGNYTVYKPATSLSNKKYEVTLIYKSLVDVNDISAIAFDVKKGIYAFQNFEFYFVDDIRIESGENESIGKNLSHFRGTINGNGHKLLYNKDQVNANKKTINPLFEANYGTIRNLDIVIDRPITDTSDSATSLIAKHNYGLISNSKVTVNSSYMMSGNVPASVGIYTSSDISLITVENMPSGRIEGITIEIKGQITSDKGSFGAIAITNEGIIDGAVVTYEGAVNADGNIGGAVCHNKMEMNNVVVRLFTQKLVSTGNNDFSIETKNDNLLTAKNGYIGGLVAINDSIIKNSVIYAWTANIISLSKKAGIIAGTSANTMANVWAILLDTDERGLELSSDTGDTTRANMLIVKGDGIIDASSESGAVKFMNRGGNKTIYGWYNYASKLNIKNDPEKYGNVDAESYYPSDSLGQVVIIVEFVKNIIREVKDWNDIARYINTGYSSADISFTLQNNITFGENDEFIPIGNAKNPFNYKFSGGNNTITIANNLAIMGKNTSNFVNNFALFGYIGNSGEVKNLTIVVQKSQGEKDKNIAANKTLAIVASENYGKFDNVNVTLESGSMLIGGEVAVYSIWNYGEIVNSTLTINANAGLYGNTKAAAVAVRHSGKTISAMTINISGSIQTESTVQGDGETYASGFVSENNARIENVTVTYDKSSSSEYGIKASSAYATAYASGFVNENSGIIKGVSVIDTASKQDISTGMPIISGKSSIGIVTSGFINSNSGEVTSSLIHFYNYTLGSDVSTSKLGISLDESKTSSINNFWVVTDVMENRALDSKNKVNYYITKNADITNVYYEFKSVELTQKEIQNSLKDYQISFKTTVSPSSMEGMLAFRKEVFVGGDYVSKFVKNGVVDPSCVNYSLTEETASFTPTSRTQGLVVRAEESSEISTADEYYTLVKYLNIFSNLDASITTRMLLSSDIFIDLNNSNFAQIDLKNASSLYLGAKNFYSDTFSGNVAYALTIENSGRNDYKPLFKHLNGVNISDFQINLGCDIANGLGILSEDNVAQTDKFSLKGIILTVLNNKITSKTSHVLFNSDDIIPKTKFDVTLIYNTANIKSTLTEIKSIVGLHYVAVDGIGTISVRGAVQGSAAIPVYRIINDPTQKSVYVGYTDSDGKGNFAKKPYDTSDMYSAQLNVVLDFINIVVIESAENVAGYLTRWNELSTKYGAGFNETFARVWLVATKADISGNINGNETKFNIIYLFNFTLGEFDWTPDIISATLDEITFGYKTFDTVKKTVKGQDEQTITRTPDEKYLYVNTFLSKEYLGESKSVEFKRYTTEVRNANDWLIMAKESQNGNDYKGQEISLINDIDLSGITENYTLLKFAGTLTSNSKNGKAFTISLGGNYLIGELLDGAVIEKINIASKSETVNFVETLNERVKTINVMVVFGKDGIRDGDFIIRNTLISKEGKSTYYSEVIDKVKFNITYNVPNSENSISGQFIQYTYTFNEISSVADWNLLADKVDTSNGLYSGRNIKLIANLDGKDSKLKTLGLKGTFGGNIDGTINGGVSQIELDVATDYLIGSMTGKMSNVEVVYVGKGDYAFASDYRGGIENVRISIKDYKDNQTKYSNSLIFWYNDANGSKKLVDKNTNNASYVLNGADKLVLGSSIKLSTSINTVANEKELLVFAKTAKLKSYKDNTITLVANIDRLNYSDSNTNLKDYAVIEFGNLFNNFDGTFDGNCNKISLMAYNETFTMFANNAKGTIKNLLIELPNVGQRADNIVNNSPDGTYENVVLVRAGVANEKYVPTGNNPSKAGNSPDAKAIIGNNGIAIVNINGEGENRYSIGKNGSTFVINIYPYSVLATGGVMNYLWAPKEKSFNSIAHTEMQYSGWYQLSGISGNEYDVTAYSYQLSALTTPGAYDFDFIDRYLIQAFTGGYSTHLSGLGTYIAGEVATFNLKEQLANGNYKYMALANYMLDDTSKLITYNNGVISYTIPESGAVSKRLNFKSIPGASARIYGYTSELKGDLSDNDYKLDTFKVIYEYYSSNADGSLELMTERPKHAGVYNYRITVYKMGDDTSEIVVGMSDMLQLKIDKANIFTNIDIDSKPYDTTKVVNTYKKSIQIYGMDEVLFNALSFEFNDKNVGRHKIKVIGDINDKSGDNYQIEMDDNGYLMFNGNYVYGDILKSKTVLGENFEPIRFTYDARYLDLRNTIEISTLTINGVVFKIVNYIEKSMIRDEKYIVTMPNGAKYYAVLKISNTSLLKTAGDYISRADGDYIQLLSTPVDELNYEPLTLNTKTATISVVRSEIKLKASLQTLIITQVYGERELMDMYHKLFRIIAVDINGNETDITNREEDKIILSFYRKNASSAINVGKYDISIDISKFETDNSNYTLSTSNDGIYFTAKDKYEIIPRKMFVKNFLNGERVYSLPGTSIQAIFNNDTSGANGYYSCPSNVIITVVPVRFDEGNNIIGKPLTDLNTPIGEYAYSFRMLDSNGVDISKNFLIEYDTQKFKYSITVPTVEIVKNSIIIMRRFVADGKNMADISFNLKQIGLNGKVLLGQDKAPKIFTSTVELPTLTELNKLSDTTVSLSGNENVIFKGNSDKTVVNGDQVTTRITLKIDEIYKKLTPIFRDAIDFGMDSIEQYFRYSLDIVGATGDSNAVVRLLGFTLVANGKTDDYVIPNSKLIDAGTYSIKLIFEIVDRLGEGSTYVFNGFTQSSNVGIPDGNVKITNDDRVMTILMPEMLTVSPLEVKIDLSPSKTLVFTYGTKLELDNINAIIKKMDNTTLNLTKEEKLSMGVNIKYSKSSIGDNISVDLINNKIVTKVKDVDEKGNPIEVDHIEYLYATNKNYLIKEENIVQSQVKITTTRLMLTIKIGGIELNLDDKDKPIVIQAVAEGEGKNKKYVYPSLDTLVVIGGAAKNGLQNGDKIKSIGGHKVKIKELADGAMPKEGVNYTLQVDRGIKIVAANGRTEVTKNYQFDSLDSILDGVVVNFVGGTTDLNILTLVIIIASCLAGVVIILLIAAIIARRIRFKRLMVLKAPNINSITTDDVLDAPVTDDSFPDGGGGSLTMDAEDALMDGAIFVSPDILSGAIDTTHSDGDIGAKSYAVDEPIEDFTMEEPTLLTETEKPEVESILDLTSDEDGPIIIEDKTKKKTTIKKTATKSAVKPSATKSGETTMEPSKKATTTKATAKKPPKA